VVFVVDTVTDLPDVEINQDNVRDMGRRILKGKVPFLNQALNLFTNAGVDTRYLVREPEEILEQTDLSWRNQVFVETSIEMGKRLLQQLCEQQNLDPCDIDLLITTSCTGFMIPSLDAYLINHFKMRSDTKRLPITELGCAAGAMALSRAREYLLAFPHHRVVIVAIELPSLTFQVGDWRTANLVSAALFGDGGAAALLSGEAGACRLTAHRTHFFHDTIELMGFDLNHCGFNIILDKGISPLIEAKFRDVLLAFLSDHDKRLNDLKHLILHPGGRRIMDTMAQILEVDESMLATSRKVLREVGNLSSASILWVLHETLKSRPQEGLGLMAAFGPGFNAEMLLAELISQ
jgi:predicted naringenin-chalcone synthase